MVIKLIVSEYKINRVLIDTGHSIYVMFYDYFIKHSLQEKEMSLAPYPTTYFIGHYIYPKVMTRLPTKVENQKEKKTQSKW